ncbi:DUF2274 domain-containing protein [Hyphococcus sp.]|uniref:DUF2274 domain-containing protein n=1 Tax=Hyphococcus sp. TaxID=2038636 RepID=UPI0035C70AA5
MSLKLGPIPERAPIKLNISLAPSVHEALVDYAALHERAYGAKASIPEVAALMIENFLESDRSFRRARKTLHQPVKTKETSK